VSVVEVPSAFQKGPFVRQLARELMAGPPAGAADARVIVRDMSGRYTWDACLFYRELVEVSQTGTGFPRYDDDPGSSLESMQQSLLRGELFPGSSTQLALSPSCVVRPSPLARPQYASRLAVCGGSALTFFAGLQWRRASATGGAGRRKHAGVRPSAGDGRRGRFG
jgi:hypothetical protein